MNRRFALATAVAFMFLVPAIPIFTAQIPDLAATTSGAVSTAQDLLALAYSGASSAPVDVPGGGRVTLQAGLDNDGDSRPDYYYARANTTDQSQTACVLLQSDLLWDGATQSGTGNSFLVVPQGAGGVPEPGTSDIKATVMVYSPDPKQGAAACPLSAPAAQPTQKLTGHLRTRIDPAGYNAPESNPTRASLTGPDDKEQARIEVFTRTAGEKNLGAHVVLRVFNAPTGADAATAGVFMQPFDLTNLHLLSGYNLGNPALGQLPSTGFQRLVRNHDFDDDGAPDVDELTTITSTLGKIVNPLNAKSTPEDWDGDGVPNGVDPTPTTPGIGWVIGITSPGAGTMNGTVSVGWTATKVISGIDNLDSFDVNVTKFDADGAVIDGWPKTVGTTAGCSETCAKTFAWDTHATRFSQDTRDGRYQITVIGRDAQDRTTSETTGMKQLTNFGYNVTVTAPLAGAKVNGTFPLSWTIQNLVSTPLPIDHFNITLRREHDDADHDLHRWTIINSVPGAARTFAFDSAVFRIQHSSDPGGKVSDFSDYKIQVTAFDAPTGAQTKSAIGPFFALNNTKAPTVTGVAVVDANGFIDSIGNLTGAINVTFTFGAGRPADDARVTRTVTVELYRCWVNAADEAGTPTPVLVYTNTTAATLGTSTRTIPAAFVQAAFPEGRLFNCPDATIAGTTNPTVNGAANDGRARVKVTVIETQNYADRLPTPPNTLSASASGRVDQKVFNNALPSIAAATLVAAPSDVGDATDTGLAHGSKVRFRARLVDPGMSCLSPTTAPSLIRVRAYNATTGAIAGQADMTVSFTDVNQTNAPNHIRSCLTTVPPWNSNLTLGVGYEAQLALAPGTYDWNVTFVDRHGNRHDDRVATATNPFVSVTKRIVVGGPFGVNDITKTVETLAAQAQKAANDQFNTLEGLLGCDTPLNGTNPNVPSEVPGCVVSRLTQGVRENIIVLETNLGCDIDNDGAPARECEDVVPTLTTLLNDNMGGLQGTADQGLPNAWGVYWGCSSSIDCPADTDLDGFRDAVETSSGTDPFNPYRNPIDTDADLVLNHPERALVSANLLPDFEAAVLGVNLHRIDWVLKSDATTPCGNRSDQTQCMGRLVILASPTKSITVRNLTSPGNGYLLKVEESPGNAIQVSTTQAGGYSSTVVDGVLDVDVVGNAIHVRADATDGQRLAEVTLDFDKIGTAGQPFLTLQVLGGPTKPAGPGADQVNTANANAQTIQVFTNPINVKRNGESVYDTVYNLNRTLKVGPAPLQCEKPGPQPVVGTDNWIRADRQANNSWALCFQVGGNAFGPFYTPAHFLPIAGVFFDASGAPVLWLDANGNGAYNAGEEFGCPTGQDGVTCVTRTANQLAGCPTSFTIQQCADKKGKDAIGGCTASETATDCLTRKALGLPAQIQALIGDLDGDGYSNTDELNTGSTSPSAPRSNPFYQYSRPGDNGAGFPVDWDADGWPTSAELVPPDTRHRSNPFQRCSTPSDTHGSWPNQTQSCE